MRASSAQGSYAAALSDANRPLQGAVARSALNQQSHFGRIGKALRNIHASHDRPIDVATLAKDAGMSEEAVFHAHFKAVTRSTPI